MECDVTLTKDEFKQIHNALFYLDGLAQQLNGVINSELAAKLSKHTAEIRAGLAGAYEQEHRAFKSKASTFEAARSKIGARAVWSIYEVEDMSLEHPWQNTTAVLYEDHWGDKPVQALIEGSTWADLYKAADIAIKRSGDEHHVFIEAFDPKGEFLLLRTGS
jgi:hypothetical protein